MPTGRRWGQRLPGSSQPSQHSNGPSKGAAGTCSYPPSLLLPGSPGTSHTAAKVSKSCWEKGGEAAQSRRLGKAEEQGGSSRRASFPLYGIILFQLNRAKTQPERKIIPSLPHISSGQAFPSPHHIRTGRPEPPAERSGDAKPQWVKDKAPGRSGTCCMVKILLPRLARDPATPQTQQPPQYRSRGSVSAQRTQIGHGRAGTLAGQGETQATHPHTSRAPPWPQHHPTESGGLLSP